MNIINNTFKAINSNTTTQAIEVLSNYNFNAHALKLIVCITVITGLILGSTSYQKPTIKAKETLNPIPSEFSRLIDKTNRVTSIKKYIMKYFHPGTASRREIYIGDKAGSKIFLKMPVKDSDYSILCQYAQQEELAYMISHRLGLEVVPVTMSLERYKHEVRAISGIAKAHLRSEESYKGLVLQEESPPHSYQFHMRHAENESEKIFLNEKSLCNAILFNIVVGRGDADKRNTVIGKDLRFMEVDNEVIGCEKTDSWLLSSPLFSKKVLDKTSIKEFLEKNEDIINSIFCDFKKRFCSKVKNFNYLTDQFEEDLSEINIRNNFKKIQAYLKERENSDIRVEELAELFLIT